MRKGGFASLLVVAAVVLIFPAVAVAGVTGACFIEGQPVDGEFPLVDGNGGTVAICADGLTELECDNLTKGGGDWFEGVLCEDLDVPFVWDGSCSINFGDQPLCVLVWSDPQTPPGSQLLCEQGGGTWFEDLTCGAPVPVLPGFGLAAMMLVLLAGALVILSLRGSLPSA